VNNKTPEYISELLKCSLQEIDNNVEKDILKMEKAAGICSAALVKFRDYINHSDFKNREEKSVFFTVHKPFVLGEYLHHLKCSKLKLYK
jgi:hypothetical protein